MTNVSLVNGVRSSLPNQWNKTDEWYNYKTPFPEHLEVVLSVDESSYSGGTMEGYHPIAWRHEYQGGKSFYTGLGHTDKSYSDPLFLIHIEEAIEWLME